MVLGSLTLNRVLKEIRSFNADDLDSVEQRPAKLSANGSSGAGRQTFS